MSLSVRNFCVVVSGVERIGLFGIARRVLCYPDEDGCGPCSNRTVCPNGFIRCSGRHSPSAMRSMEDRFLPFSIPICPLVSLCLTTTNLLP